MLRNNFADEVATVCKKAELLPPLIHDESWQEKGKLKTFKSRQFTQSLTLNFIL
jgi:hypothetical protein